MSLRFIDDEAEEGSESGSDQDDYAHCIIGSDSEDDFDAIEGKDEGEEDGVRELSTQGKRDVLSETATTSNVYADLQAQEMLSSLEARYSSIAHANTQPRRSTSPTEAEIHQLREQMGQPCNESEDYPSLEELLQPALSSLREQCSTGDISVREEVRRTEGANVYRVKCKRSSRENVLRFFHNYKVHPPEESLFKVVAVFTLPQQPKWVYVALRTNVFMPMPYEVVNFLSQPERAFCQEPPKKSLGPSGAAFKRTATHQPDTAWDLLLPKGVLRREPRKESRRQDGRSGAVFERIATHELEAIWDLLEMKKPASTFQNLQWVRIKCPGPYFNDVGLIISYDDDQLESRKQTAEVLLIPRIEKRNLRPDETPNALKSILNPLLPVPIYPQGPIPYNVVLCWAKKFKLDFKAAGPGTCSMYWKGKLRFTENGLQIRTFNIKSLDAVTSKGNPVSLSPIQVEWFKPDLEHLGLAELHCPTTMEPEVEFREGDRVGKMVGNILCDTPENVYLQYCGVLEGFREDGIWTYRTKDGILGEVRQSEMARWFNIGEYVASAVTKQTGLIISINAQGVALIMARNLTEKQFEEEKESRALIGQTIMKGLKELQEADAVQKLGRDTHQAVGLSNSLTSEYETFEDHTNNLAPALVPNYLFSDFSQKKSRRDRQEDKLIPWIGLWVYVHKGLQKGTAHSIFHVQINLSSQPSGVQVSIRSEVGGPSHGFISTVDLDVLRDWYTGDYVDVSHPLPPRLKDYTPSIKYLASRKPITRKSLNLRKRRRSPTPTPTPTPSPSPSPSPVSSTIVTVPAPLEYLLDSRLWDKKIMLKVPSIQEPTACWSKYDKSKSKAVIGRDFRFSWREERIRLLEPIHPTAKHHKKLWIIVKGEHTGEYCKHIQQVPLSQSHSVRVVKVVEGRQLDTGVTLENVSAEDMNIAWDDPSQKQYNDTVDFHVNLRKNRD